MAAREAAWVGEFRERLARLEATADAHEESSKARFASVADGVRRLDARVQDVGAKVLSIGGRVDHVQNDVVAVSKRVDGLDGRTWRLALWVAVAVGGGAGAVELFRSMLGV